VNKSVNFNTMKKGLAKLIFGECSVSVYNLFSKAQYCYILSIRLNFKLNFNFLYFECQFIIVDIYLLFLMNHFLFQPNICIQTIFLICL